MSTDQLGVISLTSGTWTYQIKPDTGNVFTLCVLWRNQNRKLCRIMRCRQDPKSTPKYCIVDYDTIGLLPTDPLRHKTWNEKTLVEMCDLIRKRVIRD